MTKMLYIKRAESTAVSNFIENTTALTWMRQVVEINGYEDINKLMGYIECAPVDVGDITIYVGSESAYGEPPNAVATGLWGMSGPIGCATAGMLGFISATQPYMLRGNALVAGPTNAEGADTDVPQWVLDATERMES